MDAYAKCVICWGPAVVDTPKILCEYCYQAWLEEGHSAIDEGCPIASGRLDDHCDACDLCCTSENDFEYCPIGESLLEAWVETTAFKDD